MKTWNASPSSADDFDIQFDIGQVEEFREKIQSQEAGCYSHIKLGKLYAKAARYDEALSCYNQAIALNPNESGFYFYRGITLFHLGKTTDAMCDFERALEADPWNKCDILNFTGCIKFQHGDKDGALEDIETVLSRNNGLLNDLKISTEDYKELMAYKRNQA